MAIGWFASAVRSRVFNLKHIEGYWISTVGSVSAMRRKACRSSSAYLRENAVRGSVSQYLPSGFGWLASEKEIV